MFNVDLYFGVFFHWDDRFGPGDHAVLSEEAIARDARAIAAAVREAAAGILAPGFAVEFPGGGAKASGALAAGVAPADAGFVEVAQACIEAVAGGGIWRSAQTVRLASPPPHLKGEVRVALQVWMVSASRAETRSSRTGGAFVRASSTEAGVVVNPAVFEELARSNSWGSGLPAPAAKSPAKSPKAGAAKAPAKSPKAGAAKSPAKSPKAGAAKAPAKSPKAGAAKAPAKSPKAGAAKSSKRTKSPGSPAKSLKAAQSAAKSGRM